MGGDATRLTGSLPEQARKLGKKQELRLSAAEVVRAVLARVQRVVLVACRRHWRFGYRAAASAAAIFCCRSIRYAAIATPMATVRMMMVASALMSGRRPSRIRE